jgi:hypothetical protein
MAEEVEMTVEETAEQTPETAPETTVEGGDTQTTTKYADKYDSVSELEKAYTELQSSYSTKLGGFTGAPEEGYKLPEGEISDSEKAMIDMLGEWGTAHQLNNDGFVELVSKYTELQTANKEAQIQAEFQKLGEGAETRLKNTRDWIAANLGEDAVKSLAKTMTTAESVQAMEKLIGMTKQAAPAVTQAEQFLSAEKVKEMRYAVNDNGDRLMSIDPKYRQEVLRAEAALRK